MQQEPRLEYVTCVDKSGLHRLAYWEWGDPENDKVLLCVHGLTRTGRDFDALARAMMGEYRVVCPDMPGRGASDFLKDASAYAVPNYVAAMVTLLARLKAGTLDYLGTSMGGLIGLGLAGLVEGTEMLYAHMPSGSPLPASTGLRFNKFILNDVGPVLEPESIARIKSYVGVPMVFDSLEQATEAMKLRAASFGPMSDEHWREFTQVVLREKDGKWVNHYDLRIAEPFAQMDNPDVVKNSEAILWASYQALKCPILIIRGETSDLLSKDTLAKMVAMNPQAKAVEVPLVGHAPTLLDEAQISIVRDFLRT